MQQNTNADLEQQLQACRAELAELTRAVQTERMARQQAEEALRETERRFRAVFEQTFQFTGLLTIEGILLEANQAALEFGGFQLADVVGRPFWEARWWTISPETQEQLREAISQAAAGQFVRYEVDVLGAENRVVTIDFSLKPVKDEREQVVLLVPEGRDITQLKQSVLQELHQETTNILESIPDGFYALDRNWYFTYVNPQAESLLQNPRDQLLGKNIWEVYPEVVGTAFYHDYHKAMTQNISYHSEEFCSSLNSWFELHVYPSKDGLSVYLQPISDRKQAEEALYQREQDFRALAENSPDIIARIDKQMRHLYVNAAVEAVTGMSPQDFIGKTNQDLGMPKVRCADWEEKSQQVFTTGQEQIIEFDFLRPDGTTRYYQTRIVPEFAKDGSVESLLTIARDVTEFKQTEVSLKESEQRFRQLAENIDAVFWVFSVDEQKTLYISPAYEKIWGRSSQPLYENSQNWMETIYPEDRTQVITRYERLQQGEFIEEVYRIIKADGSVRWINDRAFPVYDAQGRLYRRAGIAEDITERKQAEEQLKTSLQEKEALLKEVHHRVKNNLQIISSLLDLQAQQIEDAIALKAFRESQNRVRAIALIHEKLYQSNNLARINVADYIHTLTTYLLQTYPLAPNNITLQLNIDDILLDIDTVIPCGLILNELISNALKHGFIENTKGTIWIELNSVSIASIEGKAHQLTLIVRNDGIKLQEPINFSNPESLGLQLVDVLVKQLEGQIEIEQNPDTEFKIRFLA